MPRKKVIQTDNMTLTSELPEGAVDLSDVIEEEPKAEPIKTVAQEQSLALARFPDEKPKKLEEGEPQALVGLQKEVIEHFNYLAKLKLKPNFGANGNAATCVITDMDGNSVMPMNEITRKRNVASGMDKDRALINAVNSYRSQLDEPGKDFPLVYPVIDYPQLQPLQPKIPDTVSVPYIQPLEPLKQLSNILPPACVEERLLSALKDFIELRIRESDVGMKAKLKKLVEE